MSVQDVISKYPEKKYTPNNDRNNKCPIAQTTFNKRSRIRELPCLHIFTSDNIMKWLTQQSTKCPVCRVDVR